MRDSDRLYIALLPRPIDLERARQGRYRVPLAHAPTGLQQAKALAFYQPASFGEERWRVAWWAPVLSVERCTRRDLVPDEPNHRRADEPYLGFALGPLAPVDPPKKAEKGRRILFIPTTWGVFRTAETLDDLLAREARPIADDPLYGLIRQQVAQKGGIPDPDAPHQRRLFEPGFFDDAEEEWLDW